MVGLGCCNFVRSFLWGGDVMRKENTNWPGSDTKLLCGFTSGI
jgi:hypothetical protein